MHITQHSDAAVLKSLFPDLSMPNNGDWKGRHTDAVIQPLGGHESAMVRMISGWLEYQTAHAERFESGVGDDYILGPEWEAIGKALRGLLNGETGRLDCGTLDGVILDGLKAEGFEEA